VRRHKLLIRTNLLIVGQNLSRNSLELCLFFREDAHAEVSIFVGLKGGWYNEILAGGQTETRAHLPQVDEGLGAGRWAMSHKEVTIQMDIPLPNKLQQNVSIGIWLLVLILRWNISLRGTDENTSGICTVFLDILCFSMSSPYLLRNLWMTIREI